MAVPVRRRWHQHETAARRNAWRLQLDNVRFLPYQPRETLGESLAAADVHLSCLLPTMEGLIVPSKFYGILAVGRPVITIGDPDGEQARVVRAEDCGAVVSCGDGPALVDVLRQMRSDPSWVRAAGQRARGLFERRYTLAQATRKWLQILPGRRRPDRNCNRRALQSSCIMIPLRTPRGLSVEVPQTHGMRILRRSSI